MHRSEEQYPEASAHDRWQQIKPQRHNPEGTGSRTGSGRPAGWGLRRSLSGPRRPRPTVICRGRPGSRPTAVWALALRRPLRGVGPDGVTVDGRVRSPVQGGCEGRWGRHHLGGSTQLQARARRGAIPRTGGARGRVPRPTPPAPAVYGPLRAHRCAYDGARERDARRRRCLQGHSRGASSPGPPRRPRTAPSPGGSSSASRRWSRARPPGRSRSRTGWRRP